MDNGSSAGRVTLSVSELTAYVKRLIERDELLAEVAIRGEISNFIRHRSGHLYFSLKDDASQLSCVCFRGDAWRLGFEPEDGQQVVAHGSIGVYERRGVYQLVVRAMRPDGAGELAEAIAKLRAKLEAEGLFDPSHKRALPRYPRRIALVTSLTGAAVRDLVSVISRRFPPAHLIAVPTTVQGETAPESIVGSLRLAATVCAADLVIVGRGGGSLEDLWAFYDERVVRAVFACPVPVISAVGHETDVSLCDEAADLRAPTPSAAGELAVPDVRDLIVDLEQLGARASAALLHRVKLGGSRLAAACERPVLSRPGAMVEPRWQRLDEAGVRAVRGAHLAIERLEGRLSRSSLALRAFDPRLRRRLNVMNRQGARVEDASRQARAAVMRRTHQLSARLASAQASLRALDPRRVVERGFALVWRDRDHRLVRAVADVDEGEGIHVSVADGEIDATVTGRTECAD